MDPTEFERVIEGRDLVVQGLGAHACSRYMSSIASMLSRALDDVAPYAEPTPNLAAWSRAQIEAVEFEARFPPDTVTESILKARKTTIDSLSAKNPLDPALPRLLALAQPQELSEKIKSSRANRRLVAMLSRPHLGRDSSWIPASGSAPAST